MTKPVLRWWPIKSYAGTAPLAQRKDAMRTVVAMIAALTKTSWQS
jgi:hypothetical protein